MQERAKRKGKKKGKGFIGFAAMQRERRVGGLSSLNADQPTFSPISADFPSGLKRKKKLGFFLLPPPFSRTKERWKRGTAMAAKATMIEASSSSLAIGEGWMPQPPNFPLLHFSPLCALRVDKNFPPSAGFLRTHSPLIQIPAFHAYLCSLSPGRKRDTYVASSCAGRTKFNIPNRSMATMPPLRSFF